MMRIDESAFNSSGMKRSSHTTLPIYAAGDIVELHSSKSRLAASGIRRIKSVEVSASIGCIEARK